MSAPTRRALLALSGATLTAGAIVGAAVATPALADDQHPDAELIALCAKHINIMNACNEGSPERDFDDDEALWAAYDHSQDAITASEPQTMDGLVAIARAALAEAGPDRENLDNREFHGTDERWSWKLVGDLLRLHDAAGRA